MKKAFAIVLAVVISLSLVGCKAITEKQYEKDLKEEYQYGYRTGYAIGHEDGYAEGHEDGIKESKNTRNYTTYQQPQSTPRPVVIDNYQDAYDYGYEMGREVGYEAAWENFYDEYGDILRNAEPDYFP